MIQSKTLFVTGATGFLGSHLVDQLVKNYNIIALKRKSSNLDRLKDLKDKIIWVDFAEISPEEVFKKFSIDGVIHCATHYGLKNYSSIETIEANLLLPLTILEYAKKNQVSFFLNTDTILDKRVNHYSLSKAQFQEWFKLSSKEIACINIALEHFYGPGDDDSKFVNRITQVLIKKEPVIKMTPGFQKRRFIYIDDVVDAFKLILVKGFQFSTGFYDYQVGSKKSVNLRDFVELIRKSVGETATKIEWGALPYRENEAMDVNLNMESLEKLGWVEKYSLEEGLHKLIEFERERLGKLI